MVEMAVLSKLIPPRRTAGFKISVQDTGRIKKLQQLRHFRNTGNRDPTGSDFYYLLLSHRS